MGKKICKKIENEHELGKCIVMRSKFGVKGKQQQEM
jgi:hypothetical protein